MRTFVKRIPVVGPLVQQTYRWLQSRKPVHFECTGSYWQQRYEGGGNSGDGSYGQLAAFKAEVLNAAVADQGIDSVIEFGCGDGNQLAQARYPSYTGIDISAAAIALCRQRFAADATKRFETMDAYRGEQADLALSLDVIYHLVEDATYEQYLDKLFRAARHRVIIYSSNFEQSPTPQVPHVRHHEFLTDVAQRFPDWSLEMRIPNRFPYRAEDDRGSLADFYFFVKQPE